MGLSDDLVDPGAPGTSGAPGLPAAPAPGPPPTYAGVMPPRESRWPSVVGIIAIICASVAIFQHGFCAPIGLIGAKISSQFLEDLGQTRPGVAVQSDQLAAVSDYLPWTIAASLSSATLAVVLLVGAVKLTRRRSTARRVILTWAVMKMVLAIGLSFLNYTTGQAQIAAMKESMEQGGGPAQLPAGVFAIIQGLGTAGAVLLLFFLWALPLFMLVWLNRRVIREETDRWSLTSTTRPPASPASG